MQGNGCIGVCHPLRTIHGLKEEMCKVKVFKGFRCQSRLGIDELEFMPGFLDKSCPRFRRDADPVNFCRRCQGAIGFNTDLKVQIVKGIDELVVEL